MSTNQSVLSGLRVIDMGTYIFAPAAATVMSDFGADVIKIEAPGIGDPYRYLHLVPPMPVCEQEYCWLLDGRNKKSVVINLKDEAGREILLELAEKADVLITNYPPQVLKRLKLTYEDVQPRNDALIYAQASGYGEKGPDIAMPGYDLTAYWARSGLMDVVRSAHADPALSVAGLGDHPSSMALFGAIMLALFNRTSTGKGTKVSSSLMANGVWANGCFVQGALCGAEAYERLDRAHPYNPLVNHYVSRDGQRFILCGIRGEKDWNAVCQAIERPDLLEDERFSNMEGRRDHAEELVGLLDKAFASRDMADLREAFAGTELTFGPVSDYRELSDDPQMEANDLFIDFDHPRYGKMTTIDSPISLKGVEKVSPTAAPELDAHTDEVLRSLGYDDEKIGALREGGVVGS